MRKHIRRTEWYLVLAVVAVIGCDGREQRGPVEKTARAREATVCEITGTVSEVCQNVERWNGKTVCLRFSRIGVIGEGRTGYETDAYEVWSTDGNDAKVRLVVPAEGYLWLTKRPSVEWHGSGTSPRVVSLHEAQMNQEYAREQNARRNEEAVFGVLEAQGTITLRAVGSMAQGTEFSWDVQAPAVARSVGRDGVVNWPGGAPPGAGRRQ